jgi:hypothetical membrane protein
MATEVSAFERKLLGVVALSYGVFPVVLVLGGAFAVAAGTTPHWLSSTMFFLFIVFGGLVLPVHLIFAAVATDTLPEDQLPSWRRKFRTNPFAFFIFWRRYLRNG